MSALLERVSVRTLSLIAVGLISLVGGAAAIYATANGPWGSQDAATYIATARNLLRGIGAGYYLADGTFRVLVIQPPFFPWVLSVIGRLGVNLVVAARWLNVTLFVATLFLTGLIFIRYSASPLLAIPACVLLGIFPNLVKMSSSAMSEPLFIFLFVVSLFCLLAYLKTGATRWLVLAGVFSGSLSLTRYIGIAMIPAGALGILLFFRGGWKERVLRAIAFGVLASLPFLVWEAWIYFALNHSLTGRTLVFDRQALLGGFVNFYTAVTQIVLGWIPLGDQLWGLRFRWRYALIFLALAGLIMVTLLAAQRTRRAASQATGNRELQLFSIAGFWVVAYLVVYLLTLVFTKPVSPVEPRTLLPVYVGLALAWMGALACWQNAWFKGRLRWLQVLPWLVAFVGLYWFTPTTINSIIIPYHQGAGRTAYSWRSSETMAAVSQLPATLPIVSNDSYAIWVWAGRPAYDVMENLQEAFIHRDTPYGSDLSDPAQIAFRQKGAALVIFSDEFAGQLQNKYEDAGRARLNSLFTGLVLGARYSDGAIYYYPK
jgi:4-amino-4-deoxy-L-arabinose transferase-like glycosyltransferase